jgi:dCTP diphosphatase
MSNSHEDLVTRLRDFSAARDWEQFHDPKNLAEAISIEAGELLELFLWKTTEQSRNLAQDEKKELEEEVADILIFLTYLADAFDIDLVDAAISKIELNELKYPVEKAKGSSKKYSDLEP